METIEKIKTQLCSVCQQDKPLSRFATTSYKGRKYPLHRCKDCYNAKRRKEGRPNDKIWIEKNPITMLMTWAKCRAKKRNMDFDLDKRALQKIWDSQNGKCAVTGISFDLKIDPKYEKGPYRPSLDRIDSSKGYTKDNVRFVIWFINSAISEYGLDTFLKIAEAAILFKNKVVV